MKAKILISSMLMTAALATMPTTAAASGPKPGTPAYVQRDQQNMRDAYGRQTGPGGQLSPQYLQAVFPAGVPGGLAQIAEQAQNPTRPILTPGQWFPGWNEGNAFRVSWPGRHGMMLRVSFTNRYGALLHGDVYGPLPGARDPYTHRRLKPPYPAVVITEGSVQGSERMYTWLAQDLAERGYIVITYDVQGQGSSETFPHQNVISDFPFCKPFGQPARGEMTGCPGVPAQQTSNFVYGTIDATSFMLSTPKHRYQNPHKGSASVNSFNPLWRLIDRRRDKRSANKHRRTKLAIIGHSLGAMAVSYVQGVDRRDETVVALDKLEYKQQFGSRTARPAIPALAIQSEYGFNVDPYTLSGGSSFAPTPIPPNQGPDPTREEKTGFDGWRSSRVDSMLIVPRASTHLEYTDINFALPASRYGQDLTSYYVQAWLDKYLKHERSANRRLRATRFSYLEPVGGDRWAPVHLNRSNRLSFYYCSGYRFHIGRRVVKNPDIAHVGCR
jgi:dienelactone hydrolase